MSLIDKYHCPGCRFEHGDSILKVKRLFHRYAFEDESQKELPIQIGTEAWIYNLKNEYMNILLSYILINYLFSPPEMIKVYADGRELIQNFDFSSVWTKPIKVISCKGLGIRMPGDPYFDVLDVVKLLGGHVLVDTIDVFAQQTYTMSLDNFYGIWKKRIRDRLYNILSLEFSGTKLSDIVRSPSIVRELSWVRRFWPKEEQNEEKNEKPCDDIFRFIENPTFQNNFSQSNGAEQHHESSRPYVENFCLMGMGGSYTDFHIDFGGFFCLGSKIFFIAPPTPENLDAFLKWQKDKQRSEIFFGDLLPNGNKVYRLHVNERETLLLPSGWIHSVYTPEDSIVFGGNFLHSLNVAMQLKVYEMELDVDTDERFKFPFFELCNIYAAKSVAESLKEGGQVANQFQLDIANLLFEKIEKWIYDSEKYSIFKGIVKQLKRQLGRQTILQRRITNHVNNSSSIVTNVFPSSPSKHLELQDLDSSWDQDDFYDQGFEDDHNFVNSSVQSDYSNQKDTAGLLELTEENELFTNNGSSTSTNIQPYFPNLTSTVDPEQPIRLKIKRGCWHEQSTNEYPFDVLVDEDETAMDLGLMFKGKSIHGRRIRPTSRITTLGGNSIIPDASQKDVFNFVPTTSTITRPKNFISQFTPKERKQIELADKAAEMDYNELSSSFNKNRKKKMRTNVSIDDSSPSKLIVSSNKIEPATEKKSRKTSGLSSRERLAKKLGLLRKK
ncbi:Lysine-specific demethylase 7A [Meloidogyne graminicola]|uniref:Lysine-specific demethylase 7A n=1 Tax=Meloidogyne graminicola TaxID=189291 RepID=A0A8S9ZYG7_9BILA|nr:Lysine-specific demethylase 7A [Meloidogyne graminicola]